MKDCGNIRELLSPYLENELAPDELTRVKGHLGECAGCRAELELLRMTVGALRDLPELPAPAGILMGVRESLKPRSRYERLRSLIFPAAARRVPLGALASVLVAFGIFLIYDRFPEVGKRPVVAPPVEEVKTVTEKKDAPPVFLDEARPQGKTVADVGKDTSGSLPADGNVSPAVGVTGGIAREAEERTVEGAVSSRPVTMPAPTASTTSRQEAAKSVPAPELPERRDMPLPAAKERDAAPARRELALEGQPAAAPQAVAPPSPAAPPKPPPAPEPVAPPAMEMSAGRKNMEAEAQGEVEVSDTRAAGKSPRPKGEESYDYYRSDRDVSPPPGTLKKKAAAGAAPAERAASFADQGVRARSKALPPAAGADDAVVGMLEGVAALRESGSALPESERARVRGDVTEVLTVVSLDGGEVDQIRESLRQAGGRMLELRALDTLTSQQLALPHQKRIPPTQTISQGWQIRAAVPRSSVDDFVASLEGESSLQLLHRTSEPLTWSQERGLQNFEINLIR
jgi:hypothetical protein